MLLFESLKFTNNKLYSIEAADLINFYKKSWTHKFLKHLNMKYRF